MAEANTQDLQWFHEHERPLYRNSGSRSERPKQCLALSGGGLRSAAFSLGVMKALEDAGEWNKISIVSAVSGGSYALSWYLAQHFYNHRAGGTKGDPEILNDQPIERLAQRVNLVETSEIVGRVIQGVSPVKLPTQTEVLGCSGLVTQFFLYIPPFGPICNKSSYTHRSEDSAEYASRIWNTFFRNDLQDYKENPLLIPLKGLLHELDGNTPFFVINATVQYDQEEEQIPLVGRVFEFTPLRLGSPGTGFLSIPEISKVLGARNPKEDPIYFPEDLATVVSISGAAVDGEDENLSRWKRGVLNYLFKENLGYRLSALDTTDRKAGKAIVLTDGGHSENLGVFSLLRRQCETIWVVDAGEDSTYSFEDFRNLKKHLENEYGAEMNVEGLSSTLEPKHKQTIVHDSCVKDGKEKGSSYDCRTPVHRGSIINFPILSKDGLGKEDNRTELVYIKLSANRQWLDKPNKYKSPDGSSLADYCYGPEVQKWYNQGKDPNFPHYPTVRQNWGEKQFLAYVSLGAHHVRNYLNQKKYSGTQPCS